MSHQEQFHQEMKEALGRIPVSLYPHITAVVQVLNASYVSFLLDIKAVKGITQALVAVFNGTDEDVASAIREVLTVTQLESVQVEARESIGNVLKSLNRLVGYVHQLGHEDVYALLKDTQNVTAVYLRLFDNGTLFFEKAAELARQANKAADPNRYGVYLVFFFAVLIVWILLPLFVKRMLANFLRAICRWILRDELQQQRTHAD